MFQVNSPSAGPYPQINDDLAVAIKTCNKCLLSCHLPLMQWNCAL